MKKIRIILLSMMLVVLSVSIGLSAFLIVDSKISLNREVSNTTSQKHKITFTDSNATKKTMYVDSTYNLSLKDAPYYFTSEGNPIKWTCEDIVINDFDGSVTSDMNFVAGEFESSEIDSNDYSNNNNTPPTVSFNNKSNKQYVYSGTFKMFYDGESVYKEIGPQLVNNDTTIGFDAPNNNKYTLKLERDIILTGSIEVGAYTGYFGNDGNWSQRSYQGFIIGDYCTLDLNGHDLIVGNYISSNNLESYAKLDVWGVLTDSSNDKKGLLVLDKYSYISPTMVIEDIYNEKRIPYTYFNNDNIFSMYRCPYWTCNTKIMCGAIVKGRYRIDLAGPSGAYTEGEIPLIAPNDFSSITNLNDTNFLINLNNGYIMRKIDTNASLTSTDDTIKNDLLNQKIKYEVYNSIVTFDKFILTFSLNDISIDFDSSSYAFYISPYYDFYLYNTTLDLNQHLVFMPGSYLYIDEQSTINLSYKEKIEHKITFDVYDMLPILHQDVKILGKYYQPVGGLTFLDTIYSMYELRTVLDKIWTSESGKRPTEGVTSTIFGEDKNSSEKIRSAFWNKLPRAHADIYGKFTFTSQTYTPYDPIELGGEINIYDINSFINTFNNTNNPQIQLYSSTFKTDWCRTILGSLLNPVWVVIADFAGASYDDVGITSADIEVYCDVTGYYNYPLISSGYVLYDPATGCIAGPNSNYKYDFNTKLISDGSNYYAFMFDTDTFDNLAHCSSLEKRNSLAGKYVKVNFNKNSNSPAISYDSATYIMWHGAFIKWDTSKQACYVGKFFDNKWYKDYLYCTFNYENGNWKLTGTK